MWNDVSLIGRLTKNPEARGQEKNICVFTLAVNRNFTNNQGVREADFIQIKTFKKTAENCLKFLQKGSLVAVKAQIRTGSFENEGKKHFTMDIIADDVRFLEGKKESSNSSNNNTRENSTNNNYSHHDEEPPFGFNGSVSNEDWPF
jgi:single-strand DNA-binding protein